MSPSSHPVRRLLTGAVVVGAAAGAVAVGRSIARQRPAMAAVAPELRHPGLFLPVDLDARLLVVARALARRASLPAAPGVEVVERTVPGADGAPGPAVVVYQRPDRAPASGALVWMHGGGMVLGTPAQDQPWCSAMADELGILVVSVDYRLAPEHPFPAALDDCMAALAWVHDAADELGVDRDRIAVGGGSAGGGLAAAVCQRARDEGGPPVCFQLLNYPMLDDRTVLVDDHGGRGAFVWTPASNRFGWTAYLGGPPRLDGAPTHAAPARTTDLAGLPPAWIGVGELDLFHDEDVDYARRLEAAGVACELREVPGMYHGADLLVARDPAMQADRSAMVQALRRAVG